MTEFKLSIIVPCFNEEEVILVSYNRIKEVLIKNNYNNYEILFVNDGSIDKTKDILYEIAGENYHVKVISFSRNFGHQAALSAGIKNCTGDVAIIIDADLQDPPELIPKMIKLYLEENCNIVYGVRNKRKGETLFKKVAAKVYYRIVNSLSEIQIPLDSSDFRLIDRQLIEKYKCFDEKNKYIRGIMAWIGLKRKPIYYDRDQRLAGEPKYTLAKLLKLAFNGIFYFTRKPLRVPFYIGILLIILGSILGINSLLSLEKHKLLEPIISVVLLIGGMQFLVFGVLGEYIGNIFDEVKNRPEYLIDTKINIEE